MADDLLVRVDPSVANAVASRHGLKISKQLKTDNTLFVFSASNGSGWAKLQELKNDSLVRAAEANLKVNLDRRPNTNKTHRLSTNSCASTAVLPAYADPRYTGQVAVSLTCAGAVQRQGGTGLSSIHVAVIDTAVDFRHPILSPVLDPGYDAIGNHAGPVGVQQETSPFVDQETSPFVDGAGNYVLNQETSPFVDQETSPFVDNGKAYGHGTMVAGIVHLVAPGVRIVPIRAFDNNGEAAIADVVEAIRWAAAQHVDVINMSFSATGYSPELGSAIRDTCQQIICVASVSNAHTMMPVYPAALNNVIGVGATNQYDAAASFSDYGFDVSVAAPGVYIWSTYPGTQRRPAMYARNDGTSFATPFVAGAAALLKSDTGKGNGGIESGIIHQVDPATGFLSRQVGRLNILKAEQ